MNIQKAIKLLELTHLVDLADLKNQFRELAHLYHPDKNVGKDTSQRFRDILMAYQFALDNIDALYEHFKVQVPLHEEVTVKAKVENFDDIFEDIDFNEESL